MPADLMRGEETQIAGYLARNPDFCGTICLPGTHTKWVSVAGGAIRHFLTCMTGEIFFLLSSASVLRHSVISVDWDAKAFTTAVEGVLRHPEAVAEQLFSIRAECLLADLAPGAARARLSGILIGLEIAATKGFWQDQTVVVIGDPKLADLCKAALATQRTPAQIIDPDQTTLAGLGAAYLTLKELT